jgi:hypothetical protein
VKFLGTELARNIQRDMFDYMPKEYEDYRESRAIITSESVEFEVYHAKIADVLAQFYVNTATWGIADWERRVGVTPDESKPIDQRRSVVKSKLRGAGIVTKELIRNVAESYSNGEVAVTEDSPNYLVVITFTGTLGVPPNIDDLQRVIRDTLPAHLDVRYEYTYVLYDQLKTQFADYDAMATSGLTYEQLLTNGG